MTRSPTFWRLLRRRVFGTAALPPPSGAAAVVSDRVRRRPPFLSAGLVLAALAGAPLGAQPLDPSPAPSAPALPPDAPRRVVSINLCTDQLAMMLAAPGQLLSVSHLAQDPRASVMAETAAHYRTNRGSAEDIYLMQPDLVLAGTFTTRFTVELLRSLGITVLELAPADSLEAIPEHLRRVGQALGRAPQAEAMVARFKADLARLSGPGARAVSAASYGPNGYTSGQGSLTEELFAAAGLRNVAGELGMTGGGFLPLEQLVMAAPELLVTSAPGKGSVRAEALLAHPALAPLVARSGRALLSDADWVCGLPQLLGPLAALVAARETVLAPEAERNAKP